MNRADSEMVIENFEHTLDDMTMIIEKKMAAVDAWVELKCKDCPEELLRYKSAMFKVDEWLKNHPYQVPPPAEFFLK